MPWTFYNSSGEAMIQDGAMTIANNTNNRVVTATGADPASLNGEANLTFDGTDLTVGTGNVIIGTAGKGIDFSAQTQSTVYTASAEVLNHYEEGSFTPTIADNTLNGTSEGQTYNVQVGTYTRIGRKVFFTGRVRCNDLGTMTTSENARVMGFPFPTTNLASSATPITVGGNAGSLDITASESLGGMFQENVSHFDLQIWDDAGGETKLKISEMTVDAIFAFSGHYDI